MGTTYHIKYWGDGRAAPAEVERQVQQLLERFDRQMSTYREDSELSRFNRAPGGEWFPVSADTAHVVDRAIQFQQLTGGILDVTVGPLLRLWHFGAGVDRAARRAPPPTPAAIAEARKLIGAGRLKTRREPPALWKSADGVQVDLSSLAPGYAVDLMIDLLKSLGFQNAMVEIGGEVRACGRRPDGSPWRIGVEQAGRPGAELALVVPLDNLALTTAGDYRNFRTADGKRYTHIVDPRTGQALPYRGAAVTVIADDCLTADALDTALWVMGPESGYQWCVEHKVAAFFQGRTSDGKHIERTTPRFDKLVPRP
jgi:thiamine biosynthesis lipoprotein